MINLNNNTDYAFSVRKSGVGYGKATIQATNKIVSSKKKEHIPKVQNKQKTKIVYVKEVSKPKKNKKNKKKK